MNRAKADNLQKVIEDYMQKRNYVNTSQDKNTNIQEGILNEISKMESHSVDLKYYGDISEKEYLKQYAMLKNFIENEKTQRDFQSILNPIFIYICLDLIRNHHSIKEILNVLPCSILLSDKDIFDELKNYSETQKLSDIKFLNKWIDSKYKIKLSEKAFDLLIKFIENSKAFLIFKIVNQNLLIVSDNDVDFYGPEDNAQSEKSSMKVESNDFISQLLNKISKKPQNLNACCTYAIDDISDCFIHVNISSNLKKLTCTNEKSTIYLYNLNQKLNTKSFCELVGGHSGPVYKAKFTHNSDYLLSCGSDNSVYLWNVDNVKNAKQLQPICQYSGHLYSVWDLDVFSKLNIYATASRDNTARLWSFDRLFPLRVYCGHNADVDCVAFHPNGSYLATGSSDTTIRLWSIQSAECLRLFVGHQSRIICLNFSPDGKYLASGSEDKVVKIWDLGSGEQYSEFKGHNDMIYSICFDNSSNFLCSTSCYADKRVCFWSIHKLEEPKVNSNELWMSYLVDFNITTTHCDDKNVFYQIGIRKSSEINDLFDKDRKIKSKSNKTILSQNIKEEVVDLMASNNKSNF